MSTRKTDPLLLAGRVLTLIMQGLVGLACAGLAITIPILIIFKDRINSEIAENFGSSVSDFPVATITVLLLIGIAIMYFAFRFFGRLRQIIETVEEGDPFVPENADRLTSMAWLLTGTYVLFGVAAAIAISLKSWVEQLKGEDFQLAFSVDLSMILMIIVLFILARVFRKGTEMREDLEGTV